MSTPVFYFYGGEDIDYVPFINVGLTFTTTSGFYRAGYARCAMSCNNNPGSYFQSARPFSTSQFWFSGQFTFNQNSPGPTYIHWVAKDSGNIERLSIRGNPAGTAWALYKVNAAGAKTQIGSDFSIPASTLVLGKMDIQVIYSTTGFVGIYFNQQLIYAFSGDVTTDGQTSIAYVGVGCAVAGNSGITTWWSEVIVSDSDTRGVAGLVTLPPVANGNTHNFDVGSPAASNVNKITINDSTFDGATTVGLIDQYTIGSLPAGSWQITSVGIVARAECANFGGPVNIEGGVRSSGTDYWSSPQFLSNSYANTYFSSWEIDPFLGAPWSTLPANIGIKAA